MKKERKRRRAATGLRRRGRATTVNQSFFVSTRGRVGEPSGPLQVSPCDGNRYGLAALIGVFQSQCSRADFCARPGSVEGSSVIKWDSGEEMCSISRSGDPEIFEQLQV